MMRIVLGCTFVLLLCGGLAAEDKIDAKKLVGKWTLKDKKEGVSPVIEFTKDGKVAVTVKANDKEFKFDGTYKVDGNKITTAMNIAGKEKNETHTVTKLTDAELVSKDENGKEETLVRIKDK